MSFWQRFVSDVEKMKHTVKKVCNLNYICYQHCQALSMSFHFHGDLLHVFEQCWCMFHALIINTRKLLEWDESSY